MIYWNQYRWTIKTIKNRDYPEEKSIHAADRKSKNLAARSLAAVLRSDLGLENNANGWVGAGETISATARMLRGAASFSAIAFEGIAHQDLRFTENLVTC